MAYPQSAPGSGYLNKIAGLIILGATIVVFALLWELGFTINTIFDYNLSNQPQFSSLPSAAQSAFNTGVNYQLTTYGFGYLLIVVLAIVGTVAAIFGQRASTPPEGAAEF